ncbi:hypothetical protein MKX08_006921 [Trichoderma sp. CBMAI-0020]|nr:hypothetical protein MKX08_006921 [Trichoderma sp. CBMAI-0020]
MISQSDGRSEMGVLADKIIEQVRIWETYNRRSGTPLPTAGVDLGTPTISSQTPRAVLEARDGIIDSARSLLHLAAGPSKFPSIAMSYSQTIMALKWLFHFKIFDHVTEEPVTYETVATSANVPLAELKRMLRIVMDSDVFYEGEDGKIMHNSFSRAFARDENMKCGIPFFCDIAMRAAASMAGATNRWPDSEDPYTTARNVAFKHQYTLPHYLAVDEQTEGFNGLMKLLGSEPGQDTGYSGHIALAFDWANLARNSLVVDFGSGGACSWKLASMFPHLRFQVQGPQDKLSIVKDCISMKSPELLTRIDFCPRDIRDKQITHAAQVYILAGILQHLSDIEVRNVLINIAEVMALESSVIIVDSLLPEFDDGGPMTVRWESRCRDMTIRQLDNSGSRTMIVWEDLLNNDGYSLSLKTSARISGGIVTMIAQATS